MNNKIIIKNGGLKRTDVIYLSISVFLLTISVIDSSIVGIILFGGMFLGFVYFIIDRFKDKTVKIELSEEGIRFTNEKINIPWKSIGELEIKRGNADFMELLTDYLYITKIKNDEILDVLIFDIEDFKINKKEIADFAEIRINTVAYKS